MNEAEIQEQVDKAFKKILEPDNYNNPVKSEIEKLFGYNGTLKDEIRKKVAELAATIMTDPTWNERFAQALANDLARRQLDDLRRK